MHVPVETEAIAALEEALAQLGAAHRTLERAASEMVELGDDLCVDATRRLRERGASEAQIEGYEAGWAERRQEVASNVAIVRDARDALAMAVQRVRG